MGKANIIYLDAFEMERFFAVPTVESPLWTFSFVVTLLLIRSHELFAGGTENDHEVTLSLMVEL